MILIGLVSYIGCAIILHSAASMLDLAVWRPVEPVYVTFDDRFSPPLPPLHVFLDGEFRPGEPTWLGFGIQVLAMACAVSAVLVKLARGVPPKPLD